jgi:hypothetical protein
MSNSTYACTVLKYRNKNGNVVVLQAGDVIRPNRTSLEPWSDCVILGFSRPDVLYKEPYIKLARPYVYAHCIGTTSPGPLTGVEVFAVNLSKLEFDTVVSTHPFVSGSVAPSERNYPSEIIDLT